MKLADALKIVNGAPSQGPKFRLCLACGFAPVHLQTFVNAEAQCVMPDTCVSVVTGSYDDLVGNVEKIRSTDGDAACIVIEWPDFDPRLGVRRLSQWTYKDYPDVLSCASANAERLFTEIERTAQNLPICVCFPTLSLLPFAFSPSSVVHPLSAELGLLVSQLEARFLGNTRVRVANRRRVDELSPASRINLEGEIQFGFPYSTGHASAVAQVMVNALFPGSPKKAIITDLDDTLWSRSIGEVGIDHVHWDLEHNAQLHGVYQQLLHAFAAEGVLIGVASKNEIELVQETFRCRSDLLLLENDVFPFEVHWGSKSSSVSSTLRKWNITADSVVFIDDSPIELAEVKAVHPEIECIQFPSGHTQNFLEFWKHLRDLFGRTSIQAEDSLRSTTLRTADSFQQEGRTNVLTADEFLKGLQSELTFELSANPNDVRALELVNKTNQFNINGSRHTESSWRRALSAPGAFLLTATYRDRFGPLGKIAVVQGRSIEDSSVQLDCWVMSCRAFSRRIEFACLAKVFEQFGAEKVLIAYQQNDRNAPVAEFLKALRCGTQPPIAITRAVFRDACPPLFQRIEACARLNTIEAQHV